MAPTFKKITTTTLDTTSPSVVLDNIPQTYTDLLLKISARTDYNNNNFTAFQYNSDSSSLYSDTTIEINGSSIGSFNAVNQTSGPKSSSYVNGTTSTSNTFTTSELYIPSYTVNQNKPISHFLAFENNAQTAFTTLTAALYRSGSGITSITITPVFSSNFISGSTFYLYGISKT